MTSAPRRRDGQTIIELVMFLALFAVGFVAGHFVAREAGIVAGILAGFMTCYAVAVGGSLIFGVAGKLFRRKQGRSAAEDDPEKTEPVEPGNRHPASRQ